MFGTIRKHQTWLWAIIITLTIISFVIFFSPYSRLNSSRGRGPVNLGTINGQPISEEDYVKAYQEVCLRRFFMTGNWPDEEAKKQGGDVERETYQWLLLIQKEKQFGIHTGTDVVAQAARAMMTPLERGATVSPEVFIKQVLQPRGYGMDDLERFVRHHIGVQELIAAVGLGGKLATPQEVIGLYKREHEELSTAAVFFSASNYLAGVSVAPEALTQFYTNRLANYRIPDRVQVSYVKFDLGNFLAEATEHLASLTNLDSQIDQAFQQGGTNFLHEVRAKSLEEARVKIRDARLKDFQLQGARKKAMEFATPLFDMEPVRADNLNKVAKEQGLTVRVSEPFDLREGPKELEVAQDFAQKAFTRTTNDPFAGPIIGLDGVYIIALGSKIPSEIPPLDRIRAKVESDYKFSQALDLSRKAGLAFSQTLTNGLAHGKTVAELCAEAKLPLVDLPPVSISTRELPALEDRLPLNQFKQIAFSTSPGQVSPFQPTMQGGLIVYVKSKLPLDTAKMNANLPAFANYVRQNWQTEAFNAWFRKEAERGLQDTPLARQERQPALAPSSKAKKS